MKNVLTELMKDLKESTISKGDNVRVKDKAKDELAGKAGVVIDVKNKQARVRFPSDRPKVFDFSDLELMPSDMDEAHADFSPETDSGLRSGQRIMKKGELDNDPDADQIDDATFRVVTTPNADQAEFDKKVKDRKSEETNTWLARVFEGGRNSPLLSTKLSASKEEAIKRAKVKIDNLKDSGEFKIVLYKNMGTKFIQSKDKPEIVKKESVTERQEITKRDIEDYYKSWFETPISRMKPKIVKAILDSGEPNVKSLMQKYSNDLFDLLAEMIKVSKKENIIEETLKVRSSKGMKEIDFPSKKARVHKDADDAESDFKSKKGQAMFKYKGKVYVDKFNSELSEDVYLQLHKSGKIDLLGNN